MVWRESRIWSEEDSDSDRIVEEEERGDSNNKGIIVEIEYRSKGEEEEVVVVANG